MNERDEYRPRLIANDSEDPLKTAGRQAHIDQLMEASSDMLRESDERGPIYEAARALVNADDILGLKPGRSPEERESDIETTAFALALGPNMPIELRRHGIAQVLDNLKSRVTDPAGIRYIDETVTPILYKAHNLEQP